MNDRWSLKTESNLLQYRKEGMSIPKIAKALRKSPTAIKSKLRRLKKQASPIVEPQRSKKVSPPRVSPLVFQESPIVENPEVPTMVNLDYGKITEIMKQNLFINQPYTNHWKGEMDEEAVLVLSDIHCGTQNEIYDPVRGTKIVTYNESIRQAEQVYLRDSVFQISDLFSPSYTIKKLHILILGDIVTNDRIYKGQNWEIDRSVGSQMWAMVKDLAAFIQEMKSRFEEVNVVGVVGNHGRTTERYAEEPVENNFEYHIYKILELYFRDDPRVTVTVPNTRFFSIQVKGHTFYMSHGDNMRGFSRNYIDKATRELLTALIPDLPQGFDVYLIGHFHKSEKMDINEKSTLLINGCWIPRDQYGFKMFRQYSKPGQWFFGVSKKRPITWAFSLDLRGTQDYA